MADECMFGGANPVHLQSGALLRCGSTMGKDAWVELEAPDSTQRLVLPYPSAGLGGQELVVSPDERYATMFVYSGQSEVGYELFELGPTLQHLRSVGYLLGEGDAPRFSPDGRWLVMAYAGVPMVRGSDTYAEEAFDPEGEGEVLVDWAELVVQAVPDGEPQTVALGTSFPVSFDIDAFSEWSLHQALRFSGPDHLTITLPWQGSVEVVLPPPGPITTEAFSQD